MVTPSKTHKPGDLYWYEGNVNQDGIECRGATFRNPVELASYPIEQPNGTIAIYARMTPGNPDTAAWIDAKNLGEMLVNPEPPKG